MWQKKNICNRYRRRQIKVLKPWIWIGNINSNSWNILSIHKNRPRNNDRPHGTGSEQRRIGYLTSHVTRTQEQLEEARIGQRKRHFTKDKKCSGWIPFTMRCINQYHHKWYFKINRSTIFYLLKKHLGGWSYMSRPNWQPGGRSEEHFLICDPS